MDMIKTTHDKYQVKFNEIKTHFGNITGFKGMCNNDYLSGDSYVLGRKGSTLTVLEISVWDGVKFFIIDTFRKTIYEYIGTQEEISDVIKKNFNTIPESKYCRFLNAVTYQPVCSFCGKAYSETSETFVTSPSGAAICMTCLIQGSFEYVNQSQTKRIFHPAWHARENEMLMATITALAEKREQLGISKTQVANAIGINRKRISRLENGENTFDFNNILVKYQQYIDDYEISQKAS